MQEDYKQMACSNQHRAIPIEAAYHFLIAVKEADPHVPQGLLSAIAPGAYSAHRLLPYDLCEYFGLLVHSLSHYAHINSLFVLAITNSL